VARIGFSYLLFECFAAQLSSALLLDETAASLSLIKSRITFRLRPPTRRHRCPGRASLPSRNASASSGSIFADAIVKLRLPRRSSRDRDKDGQSRKLCVAWIFLEQRAQRENADLGPADL